MAGTCILRSVNGILEELEACTREGISAPWTKKGVLGDKDGWRWEGVFGILVEKGVHIRDGIGVLG